MTRYRLTCNFFFFDSLKKKIISARLSLFIYVINITVVISGCIVPLLLLLLLLYIYKQLLMVPAPKSSFHFLLMV